MDNTEYRKKRYLEHKAEMIAQSRQWKIDNKERAKELRRRSKKKHAEEIAEYMKQWHKDNAEHVSDYGKQYWIDNKEEIMKYHAEYIVEYNIENAEKITADHAKYYEEHADEINARLKAKYEANPEPMKAYEKVYYKENIEKIKARNLSLTGKLTTYKGSAKARGYVWGLTDEEFASFWQLPCHYCTAPIVTIGLDRKYSNYGYTVDNVVPCCYPCNRAKASTPYDKYISRCAKIARHQNISSDPYLDYESWIA